MTGEKPVAYVRLSPDAYASLEKTCNPPHVSNENSPTQIAYTLGQQSVLKKLRDGYVVGA